MFTRLRWPTLPGRQTSPRRPDPRIFIGVIVPDIGIGFYARAVKDAQDVLERAGYQVLVMNTGC
jgi:hypothetical protein